MLNFIKSIIKKNKYLVILFDHFISKYGFNFEKEYQIIKFINKNSIYVIDIGSHNGESIKNFISYQKNVNLTCFEPITEKFNFIKSSLKIEKKIKFYNYAISNTENITNIYTPIYKKYKFTAWSSTDKKKLLNRFTNYLPFKKEDIKILSQQIESRKLDRFNLKADLIKIDVEGDEFSVILSGVKTLSKNLPIVIIEYNPNNFKKIQILLNDLSFTPYIWKKKLITLDKKMLAEIGKSQNLTNILFFNFQNKSHQNILNRVNTS